MRTIKPWLLIGRLLGIAVGCNRVEEAPIRPDADNGDVPFVLSIEEPMEAGTPSRVNTSTDGNFTTTWQDGDKAVGMYEEGKLPDVSKFSAANWPATTKASWENRPRQVLAVARVVEQWLYTNNPK